MTPRRRRGDWIVGRGAVGTRSRRRLCFPQNNLQQIWNWNWNWNCGAKHKRKCEWPDRHRLLQYQPVTSRYPADQRQHLDSDRAALGTTAQSRRPTRRSRCPSSCRPPSSHPAPPPSPVAARPEPPAVVRLTVASVQIRRAVSPAWVRSALGRAAVACHFATPSAAATVRRQRPEQPAISERQDADGATVDSLASPARTRPPDAGDYHHGLRSPGSAAIAAPSRPRRSPRQGAPGSRLSRPGSAPRRQEQRPARGTCARSAPWQPASPPGQPLQRWPALAPAARTARCCSSSALFSPFLPRFRRCRSACAPRSGKPRPRTPASRREASWLAGSFSLPSSRGVRCPARQTALEGEGDRMKRDTRGRRRDARTPRECGQRFFGGDTAGRPRRASGSARPLQSGQAAGPCRAPRRVNPANQNISVRVSAQAMAARRLAVEHRQLERHGREREPSPASRPADPEQLVRMRGRNASCRAGTRTTASPHRHCRTPPRVARATRTSQSGSQARGRWFRLAVEQR